MNKLEGKIALVTGATEGMGFSTAQEFIKEGAFVFITGKRREEIDKAVQKLGEKAYGINADAGSIPDIDRMYSEIKKEKGKLDVLFANAGIYKQVPWQQVTENEFDNTFTINAKGVFFTVQKAIPLMDKTSSIILNGSFIGSSGIPGMSVYGATKAAVRSFARTFTAELKGEGPRINVISPGPIDTEGFRKSIQDSAEARESTVAMVPTGRMGDPRDIAKAAVFLASDDSAFVAAAEFFIDGGVNGV